MFSIKAWRWIFYAFKGLWFKKSWSSRKYLICAYPNKEDLPVLVVIYSLGQSNVEVNNDITSKMKSKIFGTTYPMGKNIKTLWIDQLSNNDTNGNNQYITRDILMS